MPLSFNTDRNFGQRRHRSRQLLLETLENRCVLSGSTCSAVADRLDATGSSEPQVSTSAFYRADTNLGEVNDRAAVNGWVGWSDRYDMYRFKLDSRSKTTVRLTQLQADLDLVLYDAAGNELASSDRPYNYSEAARRELSPGVYYALVHPYRSYDRSSYRLTIDVQTTQPAVPPPVTSDPAEGEASTPQRPADAVVDEFPDVAYYGGTRQWNLNAINAPEVWAQGYTGEGVVVAVVDTGVDLDHSDLVSNIWTNTGEIPGNRIDDDRNGFVDDVHGWDFARDDNSPNDVNGHGTHVAGIIASQRNAIGTTGVAYAAQIMPVQVLGSNGSGSIIDVAAGIRYAVDNGADIINLSLGSGGTSSVIASALSYAYRNNVFVVAASGNSGANAPDFPARYANRYSNVLSIGAYSNSETIAGFSNAVGNSGVTQVDAPGVGIYSAYAGNRATSLSGTSMATPHVAGLAALALDANPNLTPSRLRNLIVNTADHSIRRSDASGGINAARTVAQAFGATGSTQSVSTSASNLATRSQAVARFRSRTVVASPIVDAVVANVPDETGEAASSGPTDTESPSRRADLSRIDDVFVSETRERRLAQLPAAAANLAERALSESEFVDSLQELV